MSRIITSRVVIFAVAAVTATVWLVVLPRIADYSGVRQQRERQEALGINPEAMFYTDLDATETLVLDWPSSTARGQSAQ